MKYKLDDEEKQILNAFSKGKLKTVSESKKDLKKYSEYAKATMRKDKRINIRISSKDLEQIQVKAIAEGIPYQTLVSSILHKYAEGKIA